MCPPLAPAIVPPDGENLHQWKEKTVSNAVSSRMSLAGKARVFMAAISMMLALVLLGMTAKGGLANEGDTTRLSVYDSGHQVSSGASNPSISGPNGQFVAFERASTGTCSAKDPDSCSTIYVVDGLGGMHAVSVADGSTTALGNSDSFDPSISADGRFVAFESDATNLVASDTNGSRDVFVRDRQTGTTELVSVDSSGIQFNAKGGSTNPSISADGRYVAFELAPGASTSSYVTIMVHDRLNKTTELVSANYQTGKEKLGRVNNHSVDPSISADGRFVAFESAATNMVSGDTNGSRDVFVRNLLGKTTERVSLNVSRDQGNGPSSNPSISADGSIVAFESAATNMVAGDTNGADDVFVRSVLGKTIKRVSVNNSGIQGNSRSFDPSISADGRFVAFESAATNMVAGDTNVTYDVFVHRVAIDATQKGTTQRASVDSTGVQGNLRSSNPSLSADGNIVAFDSDASNLVPNDTNGTSDVFQHEPDHSAPAAPTISSPIQDARLNVRSFSVSGTAEANSTVKLFEGALSKGTARADASGKWSVTLSGVTDGSHSYLAQATDVAGNTSAPSSTRTVIVDTTKPKVIGAEPGEDATAIAPDANVYATFSEAMRATSITVWTFKLYKNADPTTALTATVSYDATANKATLNPSANLEAGATYRVLVTTGAKDLVGNVLDQDSTLIGAQPKEWYFEVISDPTNQ
jgi:Tol biopolymer transport system component